ncbi:hypothetical protein SAMN05880570_1479 [Paenibacillus sp. RU4T]|nr:hypothetical protein SAMN05880555_1481 [Paenibacillus sp. RU4X]SIQ57747.1 hypothetical protein SAMN05880570_1479 [Paenibacillus sp. RU4T]
MLDPFLSSWHGLSKLLVGASPGHAFFGLQEPSMTYRSKEIRCRIDSSEEEQAGQSYASATNCRSLSPLTELCLLLGLPSWM